MKTINRLAFMIALIFPILILASIPVYAATDASTTTNVTETVIETDMVAPEETTVAAVEDAEIEIPPVENTEQGTKVTDPFESRLMDPTFPAGTYVIPMDDKQGDVVKAFGLVQEILAEGAEVYRLVGPPDPTLETTQYPSGDVYEGGPFLVLGSDEPEVMEALSKFPTVSVDTLISSVTSDRVYKMDRPTRILLIYGQYGDSGITLTAMGLPFTQVNVTDIQTNPSMVYNYDVIIDDCPGAAGNVPSDIAQIIREFVAQGGEAIFSDIALLDLDAIFPGYVSVVDNEEGSFLFTQHNNGDFISQYSGVNPVMVYTMGGGNIVDEILNPAVRILMDSDSYGFDEFKAIDIQQTMYRVGAFYFAYGAGIVEGFAFHPGDQAENGFPDAQRMVSILIGNKLIHASVTDTSFELPYTGPERSIETTGKDNRTWRLLYLTIIMGTLFITAGLAGIRKPIFIS